jgi:4-amino-4-deoxy-L-arabinose transferase-like glycosyltransferase
LLALALRLFELGADSFWYDEAGVAEVVLRPTLAGLLDGVRFHVMATPLDYLVARAFAAFGPSELTLRLPAALWGAGTVPLCYALFRRLAGPRAALWGAALLALAPLHIRYSQELRFYAALVFFSALTTLLLLWLLDTPRLRSLFAAAAAGALGVGFHIFVALVLINPLAVLLARSDLRGSRRARGALVGAGALIGLAALVALGSFGPRERGTAALEQFAPVHTSIAAGLGWFATPYAPPTPTIYLWGALCALFAAVGLAQAVAQRNVELLALVAAAGVQIGLIGVADVLAGYWFVDRQILALLPLSLLLSGVGLAASADWLKRISRLPRWLPSVALATCMGLASLPALANYYAWPKSTAREVSALIVREWRPGDVVMVDPDWERLSYDLYLGMLMGRGEISASILPTQPDAPQPGATFLVLDAPLLNQAQPRLKALGFEPLLVSRERGAHVLLVRRSTPGAIRESTRISANERTNLALFALIRVIRGSKTA